MQNEQGRTVKTAVSARQGFLGKPVLVVLASSVTLIIVLFALVYMGFFAI